MYHERVLLTDAFPRLCSQNLDMCDVRSKKVKDQTHRSTQFNAVSRNQPN